ncbi:MAG TPA: TraR/DksA C4-type zinc finger protein [Candidatus Binataceae bacterium]|nr:TraR/DksA C4-type zinc finger protein [Candidatus Binataceae bacterium]
MDVRALDQTIRATQKPTEEVMKAHRLEVLKNILTQERTNALARIRDLRRNQGDDPAISPGDEMDVARSLTDVETNASLIERAEERLKAIDDAFGRLTSGRYGICQQCENEIAVERLKVLPFATYCVDCQQERTQRSSTRAAASDEPWRRWRIHEEPDDAAAEDSNSVTDPEELLTIHDASPFEAEEGELDQMPSAPPARRRGRPRKK